MCLMFTINYSYNFRGVLTCIGNHKIINMVTITTHKRVTFFLPRCDSDEVLTKLLRHNRKSIRKYIIEMRISGSM